MEMSATIGELAKALAKAQKALRPAAKDRENPYFKSRYATLSSCIDAIREPFAENDLAYVQPTRVDAEGRVYVTTVLMHGSGEWISGEMSATGAKTDPQGVGSLITYLKRYGLMSMTGLTSADDDDDGVGATQSGVESTKESLRQRAAGAKPKASTAAQVTQPDKPKAWPDSPGKAESPKEIPTVETLTQRAKSCGVEELWTLENLVRSLVVNSKSYKPEDVREVINILLTRELIVGAGGRLAETVKRIPKYVEGGYITLQQSETLANILKSKQPPPDAVADGVQPVV